MATGPRGIMAVETGNLVIARMYLVREGDRLLRRVALMNANTMNFAANMNIASNIGTGEWSYTTR